MKTQLISTKELGPILEQTVESGSRVILTVTGSSMRPLLIDRVSKVMLEKPETIRRGDMVLYLRDNGVYVLHRIIRCEPDGTYTFCGDNQTAPEKGIRRDQIRAAAASFARRDKWVSCDSAGYRLYWKLHLALRPFKRLWARGISFLKRHIGT